MSKCHLKTIDFRSLSSQCIRVSFALWLLSNVLLCAVPRYGAYCLQMVGAQLITVDFVYWALLPARPLFVPYESGLLRFQLGWCFWLVASAGLLSLALGSSLLLLDTLFPHRFSTILQVDYDTPYRYLMTHANDSPFDKSHAIDDQSAPQCDCSRRRSTPNVTPVAHDNAAFETDDLPSSSAILTQATSSNPASLNSSHTICTTTKSDSSARLSSLDPIKSINPINPINRSDQSELALHKPSSSSVASTVLGDTSVFLSPSGKRAVSLQQFNQLIGSQLTHDTVANRYVRPRLIR
jgi:hypothetical protein